MSEKWSEDKEVINKMDDDLILFGRYDILYVPLLPLLLRQQSYIIGYRGFIHIFTHRLRKKIVVFCKILYYEIHVLYCCIFLKMLHDSPVVLEQILLELYVLCFFNKIP